jgi:hypothetical protein
MSAFRTYTLVLSIYLNARGVSFVVFQWTGSPYDWGIYELRGMRKHTLSLRKVNVILDRYRPDLLIIQDTGPNGTRRARRLIRLNAAIEGAARDRKIPVFAYSRDEVCEIFRSKGCSTKQERAEAIANQIPEFERYVPPLRRPWMSERPQMGLFDAAALGVVFFQKQLN